MDPVFVVLLLVAIAVAIVAVLLIRRRQRTDAELASPSESPFAVSTEGSKICPKCGMGNLWTDRTCITCHAPLKG